MLRRKELLDTVAKRCHTGVVRAVAGAPGRQRAHLVADAASTRAALADDNLEAVQNKRGDLESRSILDSSHRVSWRGWTGRTAWKDVADLVTYFNGHILTIEHADEGGRSSALFLGAPRLLCCRPGWPPR